MPAPAADAGAIYAACATCAATTSAAAADYVRHRHAACHRAIFRHADAFAIAMFAIFARYALICERGPRRPSPPAYRAVLLFPIAPILR